MTEQAIESPPSSLELGLTAYLRRRSRFGMILVLILAAGACQRLVLLIDYLQHNPFAATPVVDAAVYWSWAGDIAAGHLAPDVPFFSAPLYPYFVALLRSIGADLRTVYAVQALLGLATATLLALIARRLFGETAGLLAAAIFLLMQEPAAADGRILAGTVQLFLASLTWWAIERMERAPAGSAAPSTDMGRPPHLPASAGPGACLLAGLAMGLLCLSYPPALLLVAGLVVSAAVQSRRSPGALRRMTLSALVAVALIAPATWHNYRTSGDFFPIQALSGPTLLAGNTSGSQGTFTAVGEFDIRRESMHADARRTFERDVGRPGTWGEIDRHFKAKAYAFWREDPARAARLAARKAYYFLTGRNYGDIYTPTLERANGLLKTLVLAPIATAWIIPIALIGAVGPIRRRILAPFPLLLLLVPFAIVCVFWYSPRFRLPIVPVITVMAAGVAAAALRRTHDDVRRMGLLGLLVAIGLTAVNAATGFDAAGPIIPKFNFLTGWVYEVQGKPADASRWYRKAIAAEPGQVDSLNNLGQLLARDSKYDEAQALLEKALTVSPGHASASLNLATVLVNRKRPAEAIPHYRQALAARPDDASALAGLAVAMLRTSQGQAEAEAIRHLQRALELSPGLTLAHIALAEALLNTRQFEAAAEQYRTLLSTAPDNITFMLNLAGCCLELGRTDEAMQVYRGAVSRSPRNGRARTQYALALEGAGRTDEALGQFDDWIAIDPQPAAHALKAALLERLGRRDDALRHQQSALELSPGDRSVRVGLVRMLLAAGRYDDARHRLREGLEADGQAAILANSLAWLLATCPNDAIRDPQEALRWADVAMRNQGRGEPEFLDTHAAALAAAGRFDEAARQAEAAIAAAEARKATPLVEEFSARLALYRAGKPYVETRGAGS